MDSDASADIFASSKAVDSRSSKKQPCESTGHLPVDSPVIPDPAIATPSISTFTAAIKPPKKKTKPSKGNMKGKQSSETVSIDPILAPTFSPSPLSTSHKSRHQISHTNLDHFVPPLDLLTLRI